MNNKKKPAKKPVKKAKRQPKAIDVSKIPDRTPDGMEIPLWVREMYATGKLPQTLVPPKQPEQTTDVQQPAADSRRPAEEGQKAGEELTDSEMNIALKEFYRSNLFHAYQKYINARLSIVDNFLRTTDAIKEPTEMARKQGIRLGLIDLEGYIISLIELEKREEAKNK